MKKQQFENAVNFIKTGCCSSSAGVLTSIHIEAIFAFYYKKKSIATCSVEKKREPLRNVGCGYVTFS